MTELDTIGQVRVELAELRGMMTTVVADHGRRLTDVEDNARQLRNDLTAVNENIHNKIATLLESGNKRGSDMDNRITTNTANIADLRSDVASVVEKQYGFGSRVATYVGPVISFCALLISVYLIVKK